MRIERIARTGQDSAAIETAATKTVEWARRNLSVLTRNGLRTRPRPALEGIEAPVTLGDVAHRFFVVALIGAIALTLTWWVQTLGWVAPRLI
jgi:hypothetical protein